MLILISADCVLFQENKEKISLNINHVVRSHIFLYLLYSYNWLKYNFLHSASFTVIFSFITARVLKCTAEKMVIFSFGLSLNLETVSHVAAEVIDVLE